jgi:hypothetical protein
MRPTVLLVIAAFLVGCATAPTQPATSAPPPVLAGFSCPAGEAVVGFDPVGTPVCGAPWIAASEPTPTTTTPPPVKPSPMPERFSLSQVPCVTSSHARFTIVSVSDGYAISRLAVRDATNSAPLGVSTDGGTYAQAGDVLTVSGNIACADTLDFVDVPNNTVLATIVLHP